MTTVRYCSSGVTKDSADPVGGGGGGESLFECGIISKDLTKVLAKLRVLL